MASPSTTPRSGETEAVVVIKAAPQIGQRHGETVCCAAIDLHGNWLRLYPVSFRSLADGQKFRRWDRIKFKWRLPTDDTRKESRRVDQDSLEIVGDLKKSERQKFLSSLIVESLDAERKAGKSLALLKVEVLEFKIEKKAEEEVSSERRRFENFRKQKDLFNSESIIPYEPCPYRFKYRYKTVDGIREGTCQDWEIEATFYNWHRHLGGEDPALTRMQYVFGEEYPTKGMLLAMGTHSQYPDTWLINGVVRLDDVDQPSLF
ncbi:MAG TPA: hypothetical protein VHD95_04785 [Rhizomicrobium sp.]|nr:hypothetical protein [Rhizomicrobium sp.]